MKRSDEFFKSLQRRKAVEQDFRRRKSETGDKPPIYSYQSMVVDDLWLKCPSCNRIMFRESFSRANQVCPLCGRHYRLNAFERLDLVLDSGSFEQWDESLRSGNPLHFAGYEEKQTAIREETGLNDALVSGAGTILGQKVAIAVLDSRYLMGSMGSVVGEKLCRLFYRAGREGLPVITFSASGGARMQEGIISLMQMSRTSAAVAQYQEQGGFYISVMTDPTTGGVTASFASLGDIILAEPDALIGFAGRRVIEGTIAEKLPDGFQKAEFNMKHGFLDQIVPRARLRETLGLWLKFFYSPKTYAGGNSGNVQTGQSIEPSASPAASNSLHLGNAAENARSASERLDVLREKNRPTIDDYLTFCFDESMELHGDRTFSDDPALYAGMALLEGRGVFVLGHRKGKNLNENMRVNFGMPHPEGYRKASRIMRLANRLGRPLLTFVDTAGAYAGVAAEERGQGEAIARCLYDLSCLEIPVVVLVTGEGGSGGALAIGVGNAIAMLGNALYSVISPRGFASLLWKDPTREAEAADTLKITAEHLKQFGICDEILPEPDPEQGDWLIRMSDAIRRFFVGRLTELTQKDGKTLRQERFEKIDRIKWLAEEES